MNVTVNGQLLEVPDGVTLAGLLEHLNAKGPVAIEVNGEFIPQRLRGEYRMRTGVAIRIVVIAGGG